MYGYEEYIEIAPEQLLQKITQQEIFEFILKAPFSFSARYCSPFRDDLKPDCRFEERADGTILFVDFGERLLNPSKTHRSAFGMVMDAFKVTLSGAVRILCTEFGLSTNPKDYQDILKVGYTGHGKPSGTEMTYLKKPFVKIDKIFWSQFYIKTDHLIEDNTFASNKFTVNGEKGFKIINVYRYCYVIDFIDKIKVYQPYSEKYRFITNCNENNIGNFDNLPDTGEELIIQKSYKDHRVLRNMDMSLNVIWFQNEGCVPDIDILKNIVSRFRLITIFFDNDEDGIKAAQKLVDIFNMLRPGCARMIYLPHRRKHKSLHGHYLKDPGEFIHKEGKIDFITVLKQIGINGKNT